MSILLSEYDLSLDDRPPYPVRRWSLEEYHALVDQGMFEDERVELLEGWIVPKRTRNPLHDSTVVFVDDLVRANLPPQSHLRVQMAITIGGSEPEPDLAVVRGSAMDYRQAHPGIGEILLLIEVADASLRKDRRKSSIYAKAEIPAYWIVNLNEKCVEVYSDPDQATGTYRQHSLQALGTQISLTSGDWAVSIPVNEIFPAE